MTGPFVRGAGPFLCASRLKRTAQPKTGRSLWTRCYGDAHRALQDEFGTTRLADFLDKHHVQRTIGDQDRAFIESRDMFFLSTVDAEGNPTVSYKGGPTGS